MKKILFNIAILLGCAVILIAGLAVVLIIAPGVEFFDVKYIRAADSNYEKTVTVAEVENFTDIEVAGNVVPVKIVYVQSESILIRLNQNFVGFTRTKIDTPNLVVSSSDGKVSVVTSEYEKFGYGKNLGEYGLLIELPIYYKGNLNIETNKSPVSFSGLETNINDISITTTQKISFGSNLTFRNLYVRNQNNNLVLGENVKVNGNVAVESRNADLDIANAVGGNITYTNRGGLLNFTQCDGALTVESEYGEVKGFGEKEAIVLGGATIKCGGTVKLHSINGAANIETNSGDIIIGKEDSISLLGESSLSTKSGNIVLNGHSSSGSVTLTTSRGDINIDSANQVNITSSRGKVNVAVANKLEINNGSGKVTVNKVIEYAKITSKNGGVYLSSEDGGTINNAEVTTTRGEIKVYNPVGDKYSVTSERGKINFYGNKQVVSELTIISNKGKITATNLRGETSVTSRGEIELDFVEINGAVNVGGRDKKVKITLQSETDTYFYLHSSKKKIADAPGLTTRTNTYITTAPEHIDKTISVTTRWGAISVIGA